MLYDAARRSVLAISGPARVRHPQYGGFLLIMVGFLLQWPTIPTPVMFPILAFVYSRLARSGERRGRGPVRHCLERPRHPDPALPAPTAAHPARQPSGRARPARSHIGEAAVSA